METNYTGLKIYESKYFAGYNFEDKWNLKEHPLFFKLSKKEKPYLRFDEELFTASTKVNSLQAIANFLRENEWVYERKYMSFVIKHIHSAINIPFIK